jgi:hypothetical protein
LSPAFHKLDHFFQLRAGDAGADDDLVGHALATLQRGSDASCGLEAEVSVCFT